MEKQQTAVEWFAEKDTELTIQFLEGKLNEIQLAIEKTKCLQQAKEKTEIPINLFTEEQVREAVKLAQTRKYNSHFHNADEIIQSLKGGCDK